MSALFATLPESGRAARARRSPAGAAASVLLHAAVITLVVRATLDAGQHRPARAAMPDTTFIYVPPIPDAPRPAGPVRRGPAGGGPARKEPVPPSVPTPSIPTLTVDPTVGSPDPLPGPILDELGTGAAPGGTGAGGVGEGEGAPVGGVYSTRQVEVAAALLPGGRAPRYPEALRAAGTPGRVIVQLVVDTTGRVEPATVRVVSSTDDRFAAAVRAALPALRFAPARAAGGRVRQLVELPFEFEIGR